MAKSNAVFLTLSAEEKQHLLRVARDTIFNVVVGRYVPQSEVKNPALNTPCGAFVTLYVNGRLRGCIGTIDAEKPLLTTVMEMAKEAALHDPRFKPVRIEEMPALEIEISVISPLSPVTDVATINVGEHGLLVERGFFNGLLLPQVAVENEWDAVTFLQHTCLKAGLPMDAWKDPTVKIYSFTAQVFRETQQGSPTVE